MTMRDPVSRRSILGQSLILGLAGVSRVALVVPAPASAKPEEQEVTATEDLMREHGILRRALLVYREVAMKLRHHPARIDPAALRDTALLFREFGENYHETLLEEAHIFPVVRKRGGEAAKYVDILVAQHQRGREITDYVLATARSGHPAGARATELAGVLEGLDLMYENHAAREDTIVFPSWKKGFTNKELDEKGDEFEEIEKKMFGHDGFVDAEKKMSRIEQALGFSDLAQFTAPKPPARA